MMLHKMYQSGDRVKAKDAPTASILLKNVLARSASIHHTTPVDHDLEIGLALGRFEAKAQHEEIVTEDNIVDDTPALDAPEDSPLSSILDLFPESQTNRTSEVTVPVRMAASHVV